eukprot:170928_1
MEELEQSLKDGYVVNDGCHIIDVSNGEQQHTNHDKTKKETTDEQKAAAELNIMDEKTFMDGLYEYLLDQKAISVHQLKRLFKSFQEDQYDSDVFIAELNDEKNNMMHIIHNSQCYQSMQQYCQEIKLKKTLFQIGFNFNYWIYYKKYYMIQKIETDEDWFNVNNNNGYSPHELYVEKKYNDLKQELLNKMSMQEFHQYVWDKAAKFVIADKSKKLKAADVDDIYHYGIEADTPFAISNIISIIAHEDFSELSSDIASSFRQKTRFEHFDSVKKRNREFWNVNKTLKETVQYFGETGKEWNEENGWIDKEYGPFYCGLNIVLYFPQFHIRMYGPISLTIHIAIAFKFASRDGTVIQLNNDSYYNDQLRVFNASWISNYREEHARICFGGHYRIHLGAVRINATSQNFKEFNDILFLFDCMLNGENMRLFSTDNLDTVFSRMIQFITQQLNGEQSENTYDKYIINTFHTFVMCKKQIVINLHCLNKWFKNAKDLIIG